MILLTKFQAKQITFGCTTAESYLAVMYFHPIIEDFTLPHRFQVIPPGIHMETCFPPGFYVEFLCREPSQIIVHFHMESRRNPGGIQMDQMDHVEHMEFHSLHLLDTDISVDSTWTPLGLEDFKLPPNLLTPNS
jgi:hypothetical protein